MNKAEYASELHEADRAALAAFAQTVSDIANFKSALEQQKAELLDQKAGQLSGGEKNLLQLAKLAAGNANLLLLDEPAAGMNPQETDELSGFIRKIKEDFNLTVFLIEHHMNLVMDISDRIYVLDFGKLIAEGTPEEIQKNPAVIAAYLGVEEE